MSQKNKNEDNVEATSKTSAEAGTSSNANAIGPGGANYEGSDSDPNPEKGEELGKIADQLHQTETSSLSEGERLIRPHVNPTHNGLLAEIKQKMAETVNLTKNLTTSKDGGRYLSLFKTKMEEAADNITKVFE